MSETGRRVILKALAFAAVGSCRQATPELPSVPLAELAGGERVVVLVGSEPVEVRRVADGIEARSLLCTHMGCQVKWRPERNEYRCPCHEGRYDARGNVIEGMPTGPLRRIPFEVTESAVVFPEPARG
jgi:Rieske Fe-S protein